MSSGFQPVPQNEGESKSGCSSCSKCVGCTICWVIALLVIVIWGVLPWYLGVKIGFPTFLALNKEAVFEYTQNPQPNNPEVLTDYIWWPGCGAGEKDLDKCAPPCYSPKLIAEASKLAKALPWKKVAFPSRELPSGKTVTLRGWLLSGDTKNLPDGMKPHEAPRVVLQHGWTSNGNKWFPTLAAYLMRSMGFTVLTTNADTHGYSDNTTSGITTWGYEYHNEQLGAWDYLVKDPDGEMGGSLPKSKVGIMGASMGAFITINAFTKEADVPAAWADSPPQSPKKVFLYGAINNPTHGIPALAPLFALPWIEDLIWYWTISQVPAGINVERRTPLQDIPTGPENKRPIKIAFNKPDTTVPLQDIEMVLKLLKEHPEEYDLKDPFFTDAHCHGESHIVSPLLKTNKYREELCEFWTGALDVPKAICGLDSLPDFDDFSGQGGTDAESERRLSPANGFEEAIVTV